MGFDFLGLRIVRKTRGNKNPCVYTFVSDEALASIKRKVKALTSRSRTNLSFKQLIRELNRSFGDGLFTFGTPAPSGRSPTWGTTFGGALLAGFTRSTTGEAGGGLSDAIA